MGYKRPGLFPILVMDDLAGTTASSRIFRQQALTVPAPWPATSAPVIPGLPPTTANKTVPFPGKDAYRSRPSMAPGGGSAHRPGTWIVGQRLRETPWTEDIPGKCSVFFIFSWEDPGLSEGLIIETPKAWQCDAPQGWHAGERLPPETPGGRPSRPELWRDARFAFATGKNH